MSKNDMELELVAKFKGDQYQAYNAYCKCLKGMCSAALLAEYEKVILKKVDKPVKKYDRSKVFGED